LGNDLVMMIGLGEDESAYDSNILVVVKDKTDNAIMNVIETALNVNSKYDCPINFYV